MISFSTKEYIHAKLAPRPVEQDCIEYVVIRRLRLNECFGGYNILSREVVLTIIVPTAGTFTIPPYVTVH